ncbi:hypothetical protein Tco_0943980 [Tanacetum coccineum]
MKIDLDDKTDVLTYHKKLLAEAKKEKEDLKAKVEKWHNSSKNLGKLLNTQMSANYKFGLGYRDYRYDGILSYENEVLQSVFMNKESDLENQPLYDRFVIAEGMHISQPSESETQTSDFTSCESNTSKETHESMPETVVNEPNVVSQPKVWSDAPINEEYESDSEDEHVELNKQKGKGNVQRENKPVWNNVQRVNHKNQFVPTAVLTRTGKIPVNTARASGTNNVSTARHNFNSQAVLTNAARKISTVKPFVNKFLGMKIEIGLPTLNEVSRKLMLLVRDWVQDYWLVQDQTVLGKDYSNLLIADSLLKTIWFINAPCYGNEALASPKANGICCDAEEMRCKFKIESETTARTNANGEVELTATIDGQVKTITEASLRRHLKLEDNGGVTTLPNSEIFEQLALIGGYSGIDFALFPTMIHAPETSPSRITSSPSLSPQHTLVSTPSTSQPPNTQPTPDVKEAVPMPHESPLHSVHSLGRDEGSISLNELTNLCTSLSKKVEGLESELKQTKQTYSTALTKLILRVKKLEQIVKASKSRRRVGVVESDDEEDLEDPSKHGRSLIEELDMDAGISLVPPHVVDEGRNDDIQIYDQPAKQLGVFSVATALADAAKRRRSIETAQTYTRRRRSISTGSGGVCTASRIVSTTDVSTASELGSTAGVKRKDKGKTIMQEYEPPKKLKNRVQVQMSMDEELAKKVFEEEQAKAVAEQEQERINFEAALELQK